jgi:hypothetical protein
MTAAETCGRESLTGALGLALVLATLPVRAEFTEMPVDLSLGAASSDASLMQLQLEVEPRWDFSHGDRGSAVASFRLRVDARDELEPGEPPFDNYAGASAPVTLGSLGTLELRDLYWEHRLDRGIVRLGKQQIVWGRLDGIKILDVVNPQTFREFILDDLNASRIGLWSAYLDLSLGDWRAELTWLPDLTSHDIPEAGAWFELTAPRFRFGAPPGQISPPTTTASDDDILADSAAGVRLSRSLGGMDLSALAYTGRDHEPLGRLRSADGELRVERYNRRREVLGLSAEGARGPLAWRAELSHQPGRHFNLRDETGLASTSLDQTTLGLGADLMLPLALFANVQFIWDRVHDAPTTLVRPDEDRLVTLFLRRGFAYETIQTELRWYHSMTDHDDTLVARARLEMSDTTSAYLSAEWFQGDGNGLFGQFDRQDRIVLGITHYY